MTLSLWRYAHLALALVSSLFLILASLTGIILAFDAVQEQTQPYRAENFDQLNLAQSLDILTKKYSEITEITVSRQGFVTLDGFDNEGNNVKSYVNPETGGILGTPQKKSDFIQWTTALHRSLFLHEAGRLYVGINTFLLLLIAISGLVLVIQRQKGILRFFKSIVKEHFAQYYHVVFGRLALVPIIIIALSGTYLSMVRFQLFATEKQNHNFSFEETNDNVKKLKITDFEVFKQTPLSEVQKIEFPFDTDDPEEYFTLKLNDSELIIHQFTGEIISKINYPKTVWLEMLSFNLHTGSTSVVWAVILALACIGILFFIYSGIVIMLRRSETKIRNKYKAQDAEFVILIGSENGSTLRFADAIHKQLLANGKASFLTELNQFMHYSKVEHLLVFTATHGLGDAPSNADTIHELLHKFPQNQKVNVSVVGFGSTSYPDFCGFAKKLNGWFSEQSWAEQFLELYMINDKSASEFVIWVKAWSEKTGIILSSTTALYDQKPANLKKTTVVQKTIPDDGGQTFMLTLKTKAKFTSGDLLAVYPNGKERLYSIGKVGRNIQLAVKHHQFGIGSDYLFKLAENEVFKSRIVSNKAFHFPHKAQAVFLIANGTGIAPFLGMVAENTKKTECYLYCGFRNETQLEQKHKQFIDSQIEKQHLKRFEIAYSREQNTCYVMDLIERDALLFADLLNKGAVVMLCGSLAMQRDVEAILNTICKTHLNTDIAFFKSKGQFLVDCY